MPDTIQPLPAPVVRDATDADLTAIAAIYGHHVRHGLASFEEEAPPVAEMARRRHDVIARGLPYLVAQRDGRIVGYAYCGPYRARPAYRHSVENSVYVAPDAVGGGIGRALLGALIARASAAGARQMVAVIGDSANAASIGLHAAMGFRQVGVLQDVGFKFGRWVDSVLMQRAL
jgi:phosphinothricin acetyltransferase